MDGALPRNASCRDSSTPPTLCAGPKVENVRRGTNCAVDVHSLRYLRHGFRRRDSVGQGWESVYVSTLGALAITCLTAPIVLHRLHTIRNIYAIGTKVAGRVTTTSSSTSLLCLLSCLDRARWRETDYCVTYEASGVKYHKHAVVVNRRKLVDGQVVDILVDPNEPRRFVFPEVFK